MSAAHDLFRELADHGVTVWQEAGQLRYKAPSGVMTPDLLAILRAQKAELIGLLAANDDSPPIVITQQRTIATPPPRMSLPLILTFEIDGRYATCIDRLNASLEDAVIDLQRQFSGRLGNVWKGRELIREAHR
jgi:hypothetical protein